MAAAEVECVFHGAFFLRKLPVLENVFFFFFFFFKNWCYFDISITLTG